MTSALISSTGTRNNLWSSSNLIATGTNDPYNPVVCSPIAEFKYDKEFICESNKVKAELDAMSRGEIKKRQKEFIKSVVKKSKAVDLFDQVFSN